MELLGTAPGQSAASPQPLSAAEVRAFRDRLLAAPAPAAETEQVEALSALEDLRSAEAAVRGMIALALDDTVRAREADRGVATDRQGAGVTRQIGLATRSSPWSAGVFLGMSRVLATEMPHTRAALLEGRLDEQRALALVRETACLPREARAEADARLCADPATLAGLGIRTLAGRARALAAELDPAAVVARNSRAVASSGVWLRPAVDGMSYLTALLPLAQGVGMFAALKQTADLAPGDARPRGQVMTDALVARVLGREQADAVPVTVNLVVSDRTLLGAGHEPAVVLDESGAGYGCVPAQIARNLVANAIDADAAWLRRIYSGPDGDLVSVSSRKRFFAGGLAALLRVRDQGVCRTPYCDAPVRHLDHVTPIRDGGATAAGNGQGLCEACNQAKEAPGWTARADVDPLTGRHRVTTTTPTGHASVDRAPPLPRAAPARTTTRLEHLIDLAWFPDAA